MTKEVVNLIKNKKEDNVRFKKVASNRAYEDYNARRKKSNG